MKKTVIFILMAMTCCIEYMTAQTTAPKTDSLAACTAQDSMTACTAKKTRKRVALVLSGGGAKGVAEIGAMKVIERAGIPIDMVTGTSMGSLVGGLYACGTSVETLDSIVRAQDWSYVLSDRDILSHQSLSEREKKNKYAFSTSILLRKNGPTASGGFIAGKNVGDLLQRLTYPYNDSIDFNQLPRPFACVTTNIVDYTEHVIHSGVLSQAMRASMSIPGAFSPVRKGDMVLVDGGLRNNFPVDVAKEMGADIVIGVSVQSEPYTADELGSTGNILKQLIDANCKNKFEQNLAMTDVPIIVDVDGYSAASFSKSAIDSLLRRGEEAAMKQWDKLVALKKTLEGPHQTSPRRGGFLCAGLPPTGGMRGGPVGALVGPVGARGYAIKEVIYKNLSKMDALFLRSKFKLNAGDSIDDNRAKFVTTSIRLDLLYKDASYSFEHEPNNQVTVTFTADNKMTSQLNLGVRFDTEEMVAVQANAAAPLGISFPAEARLTLRLGQRIMVKADLELHPWSYLRPTLSYIFRHNDLDFFEQGLKYFSMAYNQHSAQLQLFNFNVRNFSFNVGAKWDYYHYNNLLVVYRPDEQFDIPTNEHFYTYFAEADYNSEDNWHFPTRGTKVNAHFGYITDNLVKLSGGAGMREYSLMWRTAFPLTSKLSIQPMLYGRMLFGKTIPNIMNNIIGGPFFSHYVPQQMPFPGVGNIEETRDKFAAAQLRAQLNITKSSIVLLKIAAAQEAADLKDLLKAQTDIGGSLGYYFNSMLGPLGGEIGYSNISKKFYYYINLGFEF